MFRVSLTALLVLFCIVSMAGSINLFPTDDIYIDTIGSGSHQESDLFIANYPDEPAVYQIMMRFDLTDYDGMYIDEALLWVYRYYGCSQGYTHALVYAITEDWDEATWPEDQYVENDGTLWAESVFNQIGWNIIDVTYLVNAWNLGDSKNLGLVMIGDDGTRMSKLYSSEADNGYEPYLQMPEVISVEQTDRLPLNFEVSSYPNPFNARVNINYSLGKSSPVKIEIFNILGQKVATLIESVQQAGSHNIAWDALSNPTGVYFYCLTAGENSKTGKMLYLK